MTITGVVMIPLCLIGICLPWRYAFIIFFIASMMTPAAVVNAGSFGLQPGYFMALLMICRTVMELMLTTGRLQMGVLRRMMPMAIFLFSAVLALWCALMFFEGRVLVIGGTDGFNLNQAQPYHFRRENMTQLAYLLLNLTVVYCVAHQSVRMGFGMAAKAWDRAFVGAVLFASLVALYQFFGFYVGLPFPDNFFYSNAGYFRADGQKMVDILRINGCFEEPSTLGYFFTGFLLFSWHRFRRNPSLMSIVLMFLCLSCMLVSTSTTAFFGIGLFALVVAWDVLSGRLGRPSREPIRVTRGQLVALIAIALGILGAVAFFLTHWDVVQSIFQTNVLDKRGSSSFDERSGVDKMALEITVQTAGIGLGLGSHKPNSLLMTVLSNAGIVGLAAFLLFMFGVLRPLGGRFADRAVRLMASPIQMFVFGLLVIHSFSNPNLSFTALWSACGAAIGLATAWEVWGNRVRAMQMRETQVTEGARARAAAGAVGGAYAASASSIPR